MPAIKKGESRNDYLKRAIPQLRGEGLTLQQAVGKAEGMYDAKWKGPKRRGKVKN